MATRPASAHIAAATIGTLAAFGLTVAMAGAVGLIGSSYDLLYGVYAAAFFVLLPLALLAAGRLVRGSGVDVDTTPTALALAGGLVALLALLRLGGSAGVPAGALGATAIIGGLAVATGAALGPIGGRWVGASRTPSPRMATILAAGMAAVAVAVFTPFFLSKVTIAVAAAIAVAVSLLWRPWRAVRRPWLVIADIVVLLLAALVVFDVSGYWGADAGVSTWGGLTLDEMRNIAHFHENFYLGPVNDVLHGRTLLVDSDAVYGIGNTYLIAAWFKLVPFGYGPFGLLGCIFSAGVVFAGWGIMRAARVNRLIAAVTVAIGVMATVLVPYNPPALFLNTGGLRFLPPYVVLGVAMAVSGRAGPAARSPWVLLTFGLFGLWSVDTVVYCGFAYLGILAVDALREATPRAAATGALRSLLILLASFLAAHALFALATLIVSGSLPDWGRYLILFNAWAGVLHLVPAATQPWSLAWLLGGIYLGTFAGAFALVRGGLVELETAAGRRLILALAGMSAIGVSFMTYFLTHSFEAFIAFVAYPALVVVAIWLSVATREGLPFSPDRRRAAVGVAVFIAALVASGSWGESERRFPRTALAHLIPGGSSLGEDLSLMWKSPPLDPRSTEAVRLIDRYMPPDRALVLAELDLSQEALMRSDRANLLPTPYPFQDDAALDDTLPPVLDAVDQLPEGTRILLQRKQGGFVDSTAFGANGDAADGKLRGPLAQAALERIRERFRIRTIATGDYGLYVGELVSRDPHPPAVSGS